MNELGNNFLAVISSDLKQKTMLNSLFIKDKSVLSLQDNTCELYVKSHNKFYNDQLFFNGDTHFVLLQGVILNKDELMAGYDTSWQEVFVSCFNDRGAEFINFLRGSFSCVIYDKNNSCWHCFGDHIASKRIYYSAIGDYVVLSSSFSHLIDTAKSIGKQLRPDVDSFYSLITHGYLLEGNTLSDSVKRVKPGCFITIYLPGLGIKSERYHRFNYHESNIAMSENQCIEKLDVLFRRAVDRQFAKDKEYGYSHLVNLSGGLDSRMTCFVAHSLGYTDQLNITFSQSDAADEKIAKKIATDLKHRWLFKTLDDTRFATSYKYIVSHTGGESSFFGGAHGFSMLILINLESFGIAHSGQIGDVVVGTFSSLPYHRHWLKSDGALLKDIANKMEKFSIIDHYENEEQYKFYNRCFNGVNSGLVPLMQLTETMSPFYDVDFLEFMISVPVKYRYRHKLYKKWILEKYPNAASYIWEKTGSRIKGKTFIKYKGECYQALPFLKKLLSKAKKNIFNIHSSNSMNPIDFWFKNVPSLREDWQSFFDDNILKVSNPGLREDLRDLYQKGSAFEKSHVITALAANKQFFCDT